MMSKYARRIVDRVVTTDAQTVSIDGVFAFGRVTAEEASEKAALIREAMGREIDAAMKKGKAEERWRGRSKRVLNRKGPKMVGLMEAAR